MTIFNSAKMKYYFWNKAIVKYFFNEKFANRQILLNITQGGIEKISEKNNFGGINEFKIAVLSFGNMEFQKKMKRLNDIFKDDNQKLSLNSEELQLRKDRKENPPFLACLVFLVLATREASSSYYEKLEILINSCRGFVFSKIFPHKALDRHIFKAWDLLEEWSYRKYPNLGYFNATKRNWGPHYTVIRVNSQRILTNLERRQIYDYLRKGGFSKNLIPNLNQLDYLLSLFTWRYQNIFGISKFSTKWEELKHDTIINVVLNDLQRGLWNVVGMVNIEVLNITPFIIIINDGKLKLVYRCDIDEGIIKQPIVIGGYTIQPSTTYSGWSDEIVFMNKLLIDGLNINSGNYILRLKEKTLRVFEKSEIIYGENGWIETNQIKKGNEYLLLVKSSGKNSLNDFLKNCTEYPNETFQTLPGGICVFYLQEAQKTYNILNNELKEIKENEQTDAKTTDEIIKIEGGIKAKGDTHFFSFAPPKIILNNYSEQYYKIQINDHDVNVNSNSDLHCSQANSKINITFKTQNPLTLKIKYECTNEENINEKAEITIHIIKPNLKQDYKDLNYVGETSTNYKILPPNNLHSNINLNANNITTNAVNRYCLTKEELNIDLIKKEFGWQQLQLNSNFANVKVDDKEHFKKAIVIFKNKCKEYNTVFNEDKIIEIVKYIQKFEFLCKHCKKKTEFEKILNECEKLKSFYYPYLLWTKLKENKFEDFLVLIDDFIAYYHSFLPISIGKDVLVRNIDNENNFYNYESLIKIITKLILTFIGSNAQTNFTKIQEFISPTKQNNQFNKNLILLNCNIYIRYFNSFINSKLPEYYYSKFKSQNGWYDFSIFNDEIASAEIRNSELSGTDLYSDYGITAISHYENEKLYSKSQFSIFDNVFIYLKKEFYPTHFQHKTEFKQFCYFVDSLSLCISDFAANSIYSEKPTISLLYKQKEKNKYYLHGARTTEYLLYWQKEANEKNICLEIKDQPTSLANLYPKTIFFIASETEIKNLVTYLNDNYKFGIECNLDKELAIKYLEKSISIENCINPNQLADIAPSNNNEIRHFNPMNFRFEETIQNGNATLIEERHHYAGNTYYIFENNEYRKINCEWGKMYILKKLNKNIVFHCNSTNEFLVPISIHLPKLIVRALTACSGFVPQKTKFKTYKGYNLQYLYDNIEDYNKYWYVYQNVSKEFAKIIFEKLGQTETNLMKH